MKESKNKSGFEPIDLLRFVKAIWHKAWLVVLAAILGACAAFLYASNMITPLYSSSCMLYVNNSTFSVPGSSLSISASDLSTSQSLIDTYKVILDNETTLNEVIEKTGVHYTYGQLRGMIYAASVNNTAVFRITVTCADPQEAALLVNGIVEVLPKRVSDIIDGSSVRVVDEARVKNYKVSPNISSYTTKGFVAGALLACALIVLLEFLDDVVHGEEYLASAYEYPLLAKIPDLAAAESKKYGYYSGYEPKNPQSGDDDDDDGE